MIPSEAPVARYLPKSEEKDNTDGHVPKLHSKRVKMKTTLETSETENYTRNEWNWKLHSKLVNLIPLANSIGFASRISGGSSGPFSKSTTSLKYDCNFP